MSEAQEQLAISQILQGQPGDETFEQGVSALLELAANSVSAKRTLADLTLHYPLLAERGADRIQLYQQAAEAGDFEAMERLAGNLLMLADDQHHQTAFEIFHNLSRYGYPHMLCQLAYLYATGMGCDENQSAAAGLLLKAAAQGHTVAFSLLAARYREGMGVPRDKVAAAAWQQLAALRTFPGADEHLSGQRDEMESAQFDAAMMLAEKIKANLMALPQALASIGVAEDDPAFASTFDQTVAAHFLKLDVASLHLDAAVRGEPRINHDTNPGLGEIVSWNPRVLLLKAGLSEQQRLMLLDMMAGMMAQEENPGDAMAFPLPAHACSPVIAGLVHRLSERLVVQPAHFEAGVFEQLSVNRDPPMRRDTLTAADQAAQTRVGDFSGQRMATVTCLLGGSGRVSLLFADANESVQLAPGDVVVHFNSAADGWDDPLCNYQLATEAGPALVYRTGIKQGMFRNTGHKVI